MIASESPHKTSLPVVGPKIDYELVLDCVHCGLCTASCPTYVETGNEADNPRGRIYLMRHVIDGALELDDNVKGHIDLCLDCRACETACPSGVQYGRLIEPFKLYLAEKEPGRTFQTLNALQRWMLTKVFPSRTFTRLALAPARLAQWTGADWLAKKTGALNLLPNSLRSMHSMLPHLKPHYGRLPEVLKPEGKPRARVGLFLGCVADGLYPQTNYATAMVLVKNGCEVVIPRNQVCCGALHYHSAAEPEARELAGQNCDVFGMSGDQWNSLDAIVTNAAGCGAMLKDYTHLMQETPLAEAAQRFNSKVRDISEFLYDLGPVKPTHPIKITATYHDACHLRHAQQIQKQPRALLDMIPGMTVVPLAETEICCGAAGSYNLTQPEMAVRLGDRKADNIRLTGAKAVFTGNVGCLMQISRHLKKAGLNDIWAAHPIDALWASYSGELPTELRK